MSILPIHTPCPRTSTNQSTTWGEIGGQNCNSIVIVPGWLHMTFLFRECVCARTRAHMCVFHQPKYLCNSRKTYNYSTHSYGTSLFSWTASCPSYCWGECTYHWKVALRLDVYHSYILLWGVYYWKFCWWYNEVLFDSSKKVYHSLQQLLYTQNAGEWV